MRNAQLIALFQDPSLTRDGLSIAADVSMIVVGVSILILAVALSWFLRKANRTLDSVRTGVSQSLGPVSDRARSISDNVEFITQALRTDVERLNGSVRALTNRLHQASDRMEERIEEFNALMEVVQEEAEDIFIDTAAAVRGVRESALVLGGARPSGTPKPAGEGVDTPAPALAPTAPEALLAEEPSQEAPLAGDS
ncbi:MAG: hypothetical protein O2992_09175 [Gemmatimonadetes bacterium]|jgi:uncharacterized protein YoxC|nr:hypothetical protein [Gemmatimonadota bacterium]